MALTIRNLANGQLASSKGDLYQSATSTTTIVKTISLVNTSTTTMSCNVYASGRRIFPKDMQLLGGYAAVYDSEITLTAAGKIEGDATSGTVVDYVISGVTNA